MSAGHSPADTKKIGRDFVRDPLKFKKCCQHFI
jgi:hypothetical protein